MSEKWALHQVPENTVTPAWLYDLCRGRKLIPDDPLLAVGMCRSMTDSAVVHQVIDEEIGDVATVIVSDIVPGETAVVDLMPSSKHFRSRYRKKFIKAMMPLWTELFVQKNVRRVSSFVPISRTRTIRALKCCGFEEEGIIREGIKLRDKEPEDVMLLGLLVTDYLLED